MTIDFFKISATQKKSYNEFETKVLEFIKDWDSSSETVKVRTSGSTGKPKIFEIEKSKMRNSAEMTCNFLDLENGNSALLCLPIEYISGKMMVVRSIMRKLKLTISEPSLQPLKNLESKIDFCAMTPLQVENSLDKIHLIKNLIIGGAAISEKLKKKISQTLKHSNIQTRIFETYGMSETLSHIAIKQIFPIQEEWFTVFEEIDISLDKRSCLKINAPKLSSGIVQTNDLAEIKNQKQFRFLGRIDNVINSGGAKIFPEELENLVKKHIANEAVFLGIKDDVLGQKLILVIEGKKSETINHQLSAVNYQLSFHKPKDIIFIDKIPRTENGKIDRIALRELIEKK